MKTWRNISAIFNVPAVAILLGGCDIVDAMLPRIAAGPGGIGVASVAIAPSAVRLNAIGFRTPLSAEVRDPSGNLLEVEVSWSSLDTAVVTIEGDGQVIARAVGTALIVAAAAASGDTIVATVLQVPASVAVSPDLINLAWGDSAQLTAAVNDSAGQPISGPPVTWTSSDDNVVTVSSSGLVKAVGEGEAAIRAEAAGTAGFSFATVQHAPAAPPTPRPPSSGVAELPRVLLNTAYSDPGGRRLRVPSDGDLQAALDAAERGDVILLAPGATYRGNFVLPAKSGSDWIVIVTETALPPEGTRVSPAFAGSFARILTPNNQPAIQTAIGASRYRILGVTVSAAPGVSAANALVRLGNGTGSNVSQLAREVILDRVYVQGTSALDLRRCVEMNAAASAVIESYLSECHSNGFDSQAIVAWNTPGPLKIANNFLEGAGENVMFGGADPRSAEMIPADIEFVRNDVVKPAEWFQSRRWSVKNLFEIKTATRVLVEGNTFDGNWMDAQTGFGFVLKSVNQDGGSGAWSFASDITIRRNVIRNSHSGFNLAADPEGEVAEKLSRVVIEDNRFEAMGTESRYSTGVGGRLYQLLGGIQDLVIRHNTAGGGMQNQVVLEEGIKVGLVFENNIIGPAPYGFQNSHVLGAMAPGAVIRGNILAPATGNTALPAGNCIAWPPTTATGCAGAGAR